MDCAIDHVSMGTSRQTRLQASENQIVVADGIKLVKERLSTISWRLQHDFSNELFDAEAKQIIEHCRTICDIKALLTKIHRRGAVSVGMQEGQNFLQAMSAVTNTCDLFPKDDILKLFRDFIVVLEDVFVSGVLNFDVSKLQNRKLIQFMISKEGSTKFKNVKVIIHIIIAASVKKPVQ